MRENGSDVVGVRISKLHPEAVIPAYQTEGASGFDLHARLDEPVTIPAGYTKMVSTGLAFAIPRGLEMQVRPRSGLAAKNDITVLNTPGTVDADYRGEVKVLLHNTGSTRFVVKDGDRIAQGVICPVIQARFIEVDALDETERGSGGFGSTGLAA